MDLQNKTKTELDRLAREYNLPNRDKMDKAMLINALMPIIFPGSRLPVTSSMVITEIRYGQSSPDGEKTAAPPPPTATGSADRYPIPDLYERDLLVAMPINPASIYVCWEISSSTKEKYKKQLKTEKLPLQLKLYSKNRDDNDLLASAAVGQTGSYIFNHHLPGRECWVEMEADNQQGSRFKIMVSRHITMPGDQIHDSGRFVAMTVRKDKQGLLTLSDPTQMAPHGDGLHNLWGSASSIELSRRQR